MTNSASSISAAELMQRLYNHEDIVLIDVRETCEHDAYNIGGALIPLHTIFNNVASIGRDRKVVIYCEKGIRSQIAIQRLQQRYQYDNLINLLGGMNAWKREVKAKTHHTQLH